MEGLVLKAAQDRTADLDRMEGLVLKAAQDWTADLDRMEVLVLKAAQDRMEVLVLRAGLDQTVDRVPGAVLIREAILANLYKMEPQHRASLERACPIIG